MYMLYSMYLLLILICISCNIHGFLFKRIIFVVSGYLESAFSRKCDNIYEREIKATSANEFAAQSFWSMFHVLVLRRISLLPREGSIMRREQMVSKKPCAADWRREFSISMGCFFASLPGPLIAKLAKLFETCCVLIISGAFC